MTILIKPELVAAVKDFLADPRAEFPTTETVDKLTNTKVVKPYGFTGKQQALLMLTLLIQTGFAPEEMSAADFTNALEILMNLGNASQARQAFEKAGLLCETPGGGRKGATAMELASKWMPTTPAATPATALPASK